MPRKRTNTYMTVPQIKRGLAMRERGMSYPAICKAMEVYERSAPCESTLRHYLRALGCRVSPRGPAEANFRKGIRP